jgi:hypothetical protein
MTDGFTGDASFLADYGSRSPASALDHLGWRAYAPSQVRLSARTEKDAIRDSVDTPLDSLDMGTAIRLVSLS